MSLLEQLRGMTTVVVDTGDIEAVAKHRPQDVTTNPSLLLKAAQQPAYRALVEEALRHAESTSGDQAVRTAAFTDKLAVTFGRELLRIIPGRVSTEVDASLSFDTEGTVAKARALVELYRLAGVDRERVLIKIGSTWEGVRAAERLEREGIHCNLTLLFGFAQAVACAEAGVTLISPFVGRIYDYYVKERGVKDIAVEEDPGVLSVVRIYNHYKKFDYPTQIMGASFRKADQALALAGCDLLTISPELLGEIQARDGTLARRLSVEHALASPGERLILDEKRFRFMHNQDAMAVEKLADGIRRFCADARQLESYAQGLVSKAA